MPTAQPLLKYGGLKTKPN